MSTARPHGLSSWLHLIPCERAFAAGPEAPAEVAAVLCRHGLAVPAADGGLSPGPTFASRLQDVRTGPVGPAARSGALLHPTVRADAAAPFPAVHPRGVVRVEAGILRVYPDPGPLGFQSDQPRRYLCVCPACGGALDLYRLSFPGTDPLVAGCPACAAEVPIAELGWDPPLAAARFEVTFGDLDGRPSLGGDAVFPALEDAAGCRLREVHVTL